MTDPYVFQGRLYPTIGDAERAREVAWLIETRERINALEATERAIDSLRRSNALDEAVKRGRFKWWMFWRSKEYPY